MFTFQIRDRVFVLQDGASLTFPNKVSVSFDLGPGQPFGTENGGGRTGVKGVGAKALWNGNTGAYSIASTEMLQPLNSVFSRGMEHWKLTGDKLQINIDDCSSNSELTALLHTVFYLLPPLLNVTFADSPVVNRVSGSVGEVPFRWELEKLRLDPLLTSQSLQEEYFQKSADRIGILADENNRRLAGSLSYFHVACRLARSGLSPWEFHPEIILNLSKTLMSLFPGDSDDSVRKGLKTLGYENAQIEDEFIPILKIRNTISVGHVDLRLYKPKHLAILHQFADASENSIRELLKRVIDRLEQGLFELDPHPAKPVEKKVQKTIDRIGIALQRRYGTAPI